MNSCHYPGRGSSASGSTAAAGADCRPIAVRTASRLPRHQSELDSAYRGHEAHDLLQRALHEGRPYVLAFVDVRMPPG